MRLKTEIGNEKLKAVRACKRILLQNGFRRLTAEGWVQNVEKYIDGNNVGGRIILITFPWLMTKKLTKGAPFKKELILISPGKITEISSRGNVGQYNNHHDRDFIIRMK